MLYIQVVFKQRASFIKWRQKESFIGLQVFLLSNFRV